jgi:glutamate racemase
VLATFWTASAGRGAYRTGILPGGGRTLYDRVMNIRAAPIGVFDSGLGGLSVVHELRLALPAEDILYCADSAYCPYGERAPGAILARSVTIATTLIDRGAKLLVIACNTATSVALHALRAAFPSVPIVGLVPAVKPAAALTRSGRIAVLATSRTIAGNTLAALIRRHACQTEVILVAAPDLVDFVERGELDGPLVERSVRSLLAPIVAREVDTMVLGCTHYAFLRRTIREVLPSGVTLVDSGPAIAQHTLRVLESHNQCVYRPDPGTLTLLTSGDPVSVGTIASRLMDSPISPRRLPV